jgi:hypothetical protein
MLCLDVHPGWLLLDRYLPNALSSVGSWILFHNGEGAILEVPPDEQLVEDALVGAKGLGVTLKYIFVSRRHENHFSPRILRALRCRPEFKKARWITPGRGRVGLQRFDLGGEPLWLLNAPTRSLSDRVTVFRGFAMTGAADFGKIDCPVGQVPGCLRTESLRFIAGFEQMSGHRVQMRVDAYLNNYEQVEDWQSAVLHGGYPSLSVVPGLSSLRPDPRGGRRASPARRTWSSCAAACRRTRPRTCPA